MNLETKITIYKFTPQVFTLTLFKRKERMFPIIWIGKYMDYIIR